MNEKLTDQELARREKLRKLVELGVNPYGQRYEKTDSSASIKTKVEGKTNEELEANPLKVRVAGRVMFLRKMGKASFLSIQDRDGHIQGYISVDTVGEKEYEIFKLTDVGDIVGLAGSVMFTKTGEVTVRVDDFTFLTKSLKPLPEKFHGLIDVEERYRHRYLDLIMNDNSKKIAFLRPKMIRAIQHYLDERGFVEVETSVLQPILGGANARPFITHHNTLDKDFYLRIATEIALKKLIVGGMEKVYEIGRLFRNEGMDTKHNPEFTTIELYEAYSDLKHIGLLWEDLLRYVAKETCGRTTFTCGGNLIDLEPEFKWVSMPGIVKEKLGIDFTRKDLSFDEAKEFAKSKGIQIEKHWTSNGYILNALFEEFCEKDLIQPTFLYGHPIEISPLTKKSEDPRFTERFELYINGIEYANAYSELNDPFDQKERFLAQLKAKELGDDEANEIDYDFLNALDYGMPPTGGIGMGIDRLAMFLAEVDSVTEVILFPCMKDEKNKK